MTRRRIDPRTLARRAGRVALAALAALALPLAGCEPEPVAPRLGLAYTLARFDAQPMPAVTDSFQLDNRVLLRRITGRAIVLVTADSADYAWATDVVEREPLSGALQPVRADCVQVRVAWRRAGANLMLDFSGMPGPRVPMVDTLRISGERLLQQYRDDLNVATGYRLAYRETKDPPPLCQHAQ